MDQERTAALIERLREIAHFADLFQAPGFAFGKWQPMEKIDGVITLPYFQTSAEANRFVRACYDTGWISPDMDWSEWKNTPEAVRLFEEPGAVEGATHEQLRRVLTVMIRQERFAEGSLAGHHQSGLLLRVLQRAKALSIELGEGRE